MYEDLSVFMAHLLDVDGRRLQVAAHHEAWCGLIVANARQVLMAPRDHSKTTVALVFVLWMFFRHGTDPTTLRPRGSSAGRYQAVLFSGTQAQANVLMARFRDLLAANAWLIVGTATHPTDLLFRLRPGSTATPGGRVHDFAWKRYRAIDDATQTSLWPARHPYAELARLRDREPVMFAREYMNDPRDERATLFPRSLTQQAVDAGAHLTKAPWYRKAAREFVVLGADLARSQRIGADFTVAIVAAVDIDTGQRRVLTARRERGLDFAAQLAQFTDLAARYDVDFAFIENNGFQGWLVDELRKLPGGDVFYGHTTGRDRMCLDADGIPMLTLALVHRLWVVPSGDEASRSFAQTRIRIEELIDEGDLVAARMVEEGTHTGGFRGIPPIGRAVRCGSMTFLRVVDGLIANHWGLLDMASLLQQLGQPAGEPATS